jgi:plasmid stability protein
MSTVPTLYLRDVPESLYARLRGRARRNRRSMNAEAIAILQEALGRDRAESDLMARLRSLQYTRPEGAPTAEELIRQGRDERDSRRPRR